MLESDKLRASNSRAATVAVNECALSDRLVVTHFWPCLPALPVLDLRRTMASYPVAFVVTFLEL
jgi:hypothetical protein